MSKLQQVLLHLYGKHMRGICPLGVAADTDFHGAHFVGHALGIRSGTTCACKLRRRGRRDMLVVPDRNVAASIRVDELFRSCSRVGPWTSLPRTVSAGLVFVTAGDVDLSLFKVGNLPRKHVGIFCGATRQVWHYSHRRHKVVCQLPAEFALHYSAPHNAMFWGELPGVALDWELEIRAAVKALSARISDRGGLGRKVYERRRAACVSRPRNAANEPAPPETAAIGC